MKNKRIKMTVLRGLGKNPAETSIRSFEPNDQHGVIQFGRLPIMLVVYNNTGVRSPDIGRAYMVTVDGRTCPLESIVWEELQDRGNEILRRYEHGPGHPWGWDNSES